MESASCWSSLAQPAKAVPIFERALESWPLGQRRDQGLCQARLASANAERGDVSGAAAAVFDAVGTIRAATSVRALRELGRVKEKLAPWRRNAQVSEVSALIKGLTNAA
jgi:hypothetical protein